MKSINEDIKSQNFKNAYLLCGEETYLKKQYRDRLLHALMPEEDTMNLTHYEGKGIDQRALIDQAETMPFFADRRVILIEDSGFFKNKADDLADYMSELPDYLCLVFIESEVDKRSRMYKALKKIGRVTEFQTQDEKSLSTWIVSILKKENKKITQKNMELLLTRTGLDMGNIRMEIEKLLSYVGDKEIIDAQDIEAICTTQITNQIFDMIRAVTDRNQKKALDLYYDLLALKEPPMRILFLLAKQFNQLLQAKYLVTEGKSQQEIASALGIPPFVARNIITCANRYEAAQLQSAVTDFVQSEEDVKTGRLQDTLSVELLIVKYSSL